jgi:hypothetical protein
MRAFITCNPVILCASFPLSGVQATPAIINAAPIHAITKRKEKRLCILGLLLPLMVDHSARKPNTAEASHSYRLGDSIFTTLTSPE